LVENPVLWGEVTADECVVHLWCPVIMILSLCYDCLWGACYFISGYTLHISLRRRLMASAEKMAPTKLGMGWFINVWISDAGHVNPLLQKFFQDMW